MLFNSSHTEDGRSGMFGLTLLSLRAEWAFDLDTIQFGLQTGLDKSAGYWYAKVFFGPFQAAILVLWGPLMRKTPEDPKNKAKDEVSGPKTDKPA